MPLPPAELDTEHHLLGALIRDGLALPDALNPSDFFEPKHQDVAHALVRVYESGVAIDEQTVSAELRNYGSVVTAGEVSAMTSHFTAINPAWADSIKRTAVLRHIELETRRVADYATDPSASPDALLIHLEQSLALARSRAKGKTVGPQRMDFDALLDFDRKADPNTILGNRWLCNGGSLLIVGQSGTGKSSLMMQAAVHWCLGRDFFGIKPVKPLKAIILQAENDAGDIGEALQDVVAGAYLDERERSQLRDALAIFRDTISTGTTFTKALADLVRAHQADIVFVDPLLSFAGIDVSDQEQASKFLRHDLAPILLETGAILVAMHHTGKPKSASDKEGHTVADLAYAGLGSSEFTNYFREVAVLFRCPGDEPIYKFGLTKRRGRAGLKDSEGQFKGEIHIRHAAEKGVIRWEYSQPPSQNATEVAPRHSDSSHAKGSPRRLKLD